MASGRSESIRAIPHNSSVTTMPLPMDVSTSNKVLKFDCYLEIIFSYINVYMHDRILLRGGSHGPRIQLRNSETLAVLLSEMKRVSITTRYG